jgi:DNA-binding response OmpR family regulator
MKVLFITGYGENAAIGTGRPERGTDVMTKPFSMSALAAKVRTIADPHV